MGSFVVLPLTPALSPSAFGVRLDLQAYVIGGRLASLALPSLALQGNLELGTIPAVYL